LRYQPQLRDARGRRISRTPESTRIQDEIEQEIRRAARRFQVSRSFVIATALADYFGIEMIGYHELDAPMKKTRAA
jgi:predicted transcriptional regulator